MNGDDYMDWLLSLPNDERDAYENKEVAYECMGYIGYQKMDLSDMIRQQDEEQDRDEADVWF